MSKNLVGSKIPEFSLLNQEGKMIRTTDYLGKPLVIYFYPKDDTPGCTAEACSFRDQYEEFVAAGATVFGISADSVDDHQQFSSKYKLPFDLLSDTDKKVADMFGVPTSLFGLIPGRITYIADQGGIIRHVFNSQFNFKRHISEALKAIRKMGADDNNQIQ